MTEDSKGHGVLEIKQGVEEEKRSDGSSAKWKSSAVNHRSFISERSERPGQVDTYGPERSLPERYAAKERSIARESSVARERSRARERSVARALSQAREIIRERSGE